jgi:hypothetical protein
MRADDVQAQRDQLLGVLKGRVKPLNVAQIMAETQRRNVNQVRRNLNWLAAEGILIKLPGAKNSFTYKIRNQVETQVQTQTEIVARQVNPGGLAMLLKSLAVKRWESSTTKSSRAIPYCVRKLYEYAHDRATGGPRPQADYDYVRSELQAFHDDLVNSLATVRGILERKELWDAKESAKWLLSAGGSSQEYANLANQAQERQA